MAFVSKDDLIRLYVTEKNSMRTVAERLNVSVGAVYSHMKLYGIESRPRMTDETRKKISNANKGKLLGRKRGAMSDETKRKLSESRRGKYKNATEFGGHRKLRKDGYVSIYCPLHKHATKDGYIMEHILVAEAQLGRELTDDEIVHHKNKNRADNRVENLEVMTFHEHASMHMRERWAKRKEQ